MHLTITEQEFTFSVTSWLRGDCRVLLDCVARGSRGGAGLRAVGAREEAPWLGGDLQDVCCCDFAFDFGLTWSYLSPEKKNGYTYITAQYTELEMWIVFFNNVNFANM